MCIRDSLGPGNGRLVRGWQRGWPPGAGDGASGTRLPARPAARGRGRGVACEDASETGERLYSGDDSRNVIAWDLGKAAGRTRVWETADGERTERLECDGGVKCMEITADRRLLLTGDDGGPSIHLAFLL